MVQSVAVSPPARRQALHLPLLLLYALNLRTVLLAVSPLLPFIQHDLQLNYTATGLLSNLPILLMGALAFPAALLIARLGPRRAVTAALVILAGGGVLRGFSTTAWLLFGTTTLLSLGVTLGQTTSPTLVQSWFPQRIGQTTAAYSVGLMTGEIVGAAITVPWVVLLMGHSWHGALIFWALPALLTLIVWVFSTGDLVPPARAQAPAGHTAATAAGHGAPAIPWRVALIAAVGMGCASIMFFGMSTWIPVYFHALGRSDTPAALAALTIVQLPPSLALSVWNRRFLSVRAGFVIGGGVAVATMILWFLGPADWDSALAGLIGASSAVVFIMGLSVPAQLGQGAQVARISGIMLTISYSLAFLVPSAGGVLWDRTGIPQTAFIPNLVAAIATVICGALIPDLRRQGTAPQDIMPAGVL